MESHEQENTQRGAQLEFSGMRPRGRLTIARRDLDLIVSRLLAGLAARAGDGDEDAASVALRAMHKEILWSALPDGAAEPGGTLQGSHGPSVVPGSSFLVDLESSLRHADAFDGGLIGTSAIRALVCKAQKAMMLDDEARNLVLDEAGRACSGNRLSRQDKPSEHERGYNRGVRACMASIAALRTPERAQEDAADLQDSAGCAHWLTQRGTEMILLSDGTVIDVHGGDVVSAVAAVRAPNANIAPAAATRSRQRERLYLAAIGCAHEITDDVIVLHRDRRRDGNALRQLGDRLAAACPEVLVPDSVRRAVERMSEPRDDSRLSGLTATLDAQCMALISEFIGSLSTEPAAHARAPSRENEQWISAAVHEARILLAREAAYTRAFFDITLLFPGRRQHIANLLAHGWELTGFEMSPRHAVAALLEHGERLGSERFDADIDLVVRRKAWPRPIKAGANGK